MKTQTQTQAEVNKVEVAQEVANRMPIIKKAVKKTFGSLVGMRKYMGKKENRDCRFIVFSDGTTTVEPNWVNRATLGIYVHNTMDREHCTKKWADVEEYIAFWLELENFGK